MITEEEARQRLETLWAKSHVGLWGQFEIANRGDRLEAMEWAIRLFKDLDFIETNSDESDTSYAGGYVGTLGTTQSTISSKTRSTSFDGSSNGQNKPNPNT